MAWIVALTTLGIKSFAVELKEGPGKAAVVTHCQTCHSLDYVQMNLFLDEKGWTKTVDKMIHVYGAPIPKEDVPVIVKYLAGKS